MLKVRVIPCLDVHAGRVVKGIQFVSLRDTGEPAACARAYDAAGADELCFLDISASHESRRTMACAVERTADACHLPITVGGGVRSLDDIRTLMLAGADKVSINTAAVADPSLVTRAAERFGSQAVVVALDARRMSATGGSAPRYRLYTGGGRTPTDLDAVSFAKSIVERGCGEILLTSMDRDGTRNGFDLELTRAVADAVSVPVIASGGVGNCQHLVEGVRSGHASAVLAASIFHFGEISVSQAKDALHAAGIPVRRDACVPGSGLAEW